MLVDMEKWLDNCEYYLYNKEIFGFKPKVTIREEKLILECEGADGLLKKELRSLLNDVLLDGVKLAALTRFRFRDETYREVIKEKWDAFFWDNEEFLMNLLLNEGPETFLDVVDSARERLDAAYFLDSLEYVNGHWTGLDGYVYAGGLWHFPDEDGKYLTPLDFFAIEWDNLLKDKSRIKKTAASISSVRIEYVPDTFDFHYSILDRARYDKKKGLTGPVPEGGCVLWEHFCAA